MGTYIGDQGISRDDELMHHGILGMRWGHRKQKPVSSGRRIRRRSIGSTVKAGFRGAEVGVGMNYARLHRVSRNTGIKMYRQKRRKKAVGLVLGGVAGGLYAASKVYKSNVGHVATPASIALGKASIQMGVTVGALIGFGAGAAAGSIKNAVMARDEHKYGRT